MYGDLIWLGPLSVLSGMHTVLASSLVNWLLRSNLNFIAFEKVMSNVINLRITEVAFIVVAICEKRGATQIPEK